jgi:hypothetical protein
MSLQKLSLKNTKERWKAYAASAFSLGVFILRAWA